VRYLLGATYYSAVPTIPSVGHLLIHILDCIYRLHLLLWPHFYRFDLVTSLLSSARPVTSRSLHLIRARHFSDIVRILMRQLRLDEGHCRPELRSLLQIILGHATRTERSPA